LAFGIEAIDADERGLFCLCRIRIFDHHGLQTFSANQDDFHRQSALDAQLSIMQPILQSV
jgi:hypothetical protein